MSAEIQDGSGREVGSGAEAEAEAGHGVGGVGGVGHEVDQDVDEEFDQDLDQPLDAAEFFTLLKESKSAVADAAAEPTVTATAPPPPAPMETAPTVVAPPMIPSQANPQDPWGRPWGGQPMAGQPMSGQPWSDQPWEQPPPPKRERRVLRAVGRWTSAVLAMGAIGAGTAYAVSVPARTNIPTLATKNDGRYFFPAYAKPPLPAGELPPGDANNKYQNHYGDIRQYLLQPPTGAVNDAAFPGVTGWAVPKDFCASFIDTETACSSLAERGLRRIAARGWTTPDGVHTMVWLLQFPDQSAASYADTTLPAPMHTFSDVQAFDGPGPEAMVWGVGSTAATPGKTVPIAVYKTVLKADGSSAGALTGRFAHVALGDTVEVVETQGPKSVPETPTDQIVMLQAELLR